MSAGLQTVPTRAKQAVREVIETNKGDSRALQPVLAEVLTEVVRTPLKEVVKEAVREVQEDSSATTKRQRGRKFVYFGLGVALGYLAASGRLPTEQREAVVEEAQSRLPIGPEEDGDQEEKEESDEEQTQYGGGTQDIDAVEQTDRITDENEGEGDESEESTDTE